MNILFYSNYCDYCQKLIDLINSKKIINAFKLICIDNNFDIPKNIKQVPTLLIEEIGRPLEGKYVFEWILNKDYFNLKTNNIANKKPNKMPKIQNSKIKGQIIDDKYAFLDN